MMTLYMELQKITYELPLTELIRLSLRLENLFSRLDIVFACNPEKQTQTLIALLIDILNVLDRPDLKGKFAKEFYRLITVFEKLEGDSNANQDALAETLEQLRTLTKYFVNVPGKIAQSLRNNELIAIIRQNFLKLGGSSIFDAPPYFYWLEQPWETQEKQINHWLLAFAEIREATELLLKIVRHSSEPRSVSATRGFYHETLDPHAACQLIRVTLPKNTKIYPEISAGKHGVSLRLMKHVAKDKPVQSEKNISFTLTTCTI